MKYSFINCSFFIIALLIPSICVFAPMGTWIPLVLSSILIVYFSKNFYQNTPHHKFLLILFCFLFWLLISIVLNFKSSGQIIKLIELIIITLSGFLLCKASLYKKRFKGFTILFTISFIVSSILMLIDIYGSFGIKLWLSKNLDFNNFENFYSVKEWVSLKSFRNEYFYSIQSYLNNSYDRGIAALTILVMPITCLCLNLKIKKLKILLITIILVLVLVLSLNNLAVFLSVIVSFILATLFFFTKKFYRKTFIFIILTYMMSAPALLGFLDYKNFYHYETSINNKLKYFSDKYRHTKCEMVLKKEFKYFNKSQIENLNKELIGKTVSIDEINNAAKNVQNFFLKKGESPVYVLVPLLKISDHNEIHFIISKENVKIKELNSGHKNKIKVHGIRYIPLNCSFNLISFYFAKAHINDPIEIFEFQAYYLASKIIHRLTIWSFVKEKILEKPLFGHGFFTSGKIGESYQIKNLNNAKINAIPLHPHNATMQLWMELGLVGVVLFSILLALLINRIYKESKLNFLNSAFAFISLIQFFLIGQISYGFWQPWWISINIICFISYYLLFNKRGLKNFS